MPRLPPLPRLDWTDAGVPRAAGFDDVYFSREGGLAESDAVFLAGCGLPERWRDKDRFAVCELGFGAGLNVLAAWRAWKKTRSPHAILHISTIEAFPLARDDAARALSHFPEIAELSEQLLARWPVRAYAPQRLWFEADGFALTLHTGDAETILAGMSGGFDAWFLDGFAPARNETMWSEAIFSQIARLSNPGARAATFTVAGSVRRGLEASGFAVEKKPGFGTKRERLEAWRKERGSSDPHLAPASADAGPKTRGPFFPYAAANPKRVAILGAGIAGAACAHALTRRGVETIVLEAETALGAGASGNPAGLVMPRFDRGDGPARELYLAAYLEAVATYEALGDDIYRACGVEQRADARAGEALADLLADPPLPEDWLSARGELAWHPRAGVVSPQAAVRALLDGAQLMLEAPVERMDRAGDGWVLRAPDGRAMLKADAVVLACGAALHRFAPASFLPIALSRGQIEWGEGAALAHALTGGNYVAPFNGGVLFGATFDAHDADANEDALLVDARARNLAALVKLAPEIAGSVKLNTLHSRAGLRATTPDRMPIAGLLPDADAWLAQYAALAHGGMVDTTLTPPSHRGIYVIGGLGARGLTLAPLLGERLAAEMCAEPQILSQSVLNAIHPARFLQRALKRR